MFWNKKKESEPIVFEVQQDFSKDAHTLDVLKRWIERNDAMFNSGQRTEAEWVKERLFLDGRLAELERKYAKDLGNV